MAPAVRPFWSLPVLAVTVAVALALFCVTTPQQAHAIQIPKGLEDGFCKNLLAGPHAAGAPQTVAWCNARPASTSTRPSPTHGRTPTPTPTPVQDGNQLSLTVHCDFVVVGAGSGGSELAARLAKGLPHLQTCLTSTGGDPRGKNDTAVELYSFDLFGQPNHIYLVDDKNTRDVPNWQYPEPILNGGGTGVNGGTIVLPPKIWWDRFESAHGFKSWNFANMRAIVQSVENYTSPDPLHNHGHNGSMIVTAPPPEAETLVLSQALADIIGTVVVPDLDNFTLGVGPAGRTIDLDGNRQNIYLKAIQPLVDARQPNLRVFEFTRCSRLTYADAAVDAEGHAVPAPIPQVINGTLHGTARRATGILCVNQANNTAIQFLVSKKTILAAELGNAKMLQRSGVGPCEFLATLGIPCVVNNSHVGQHLKSSYSLGLVYLATGPSPATHNNGNVNLGYFQSAVAKAQGFGLPDVQPGIAYGAPKTWFVLCFVHRYTSEGTCNLKSADVNNNEDVYINLYNSPLDIIPMNECINATRRTFELGGVRGVPTVEIFPGLDALPNEPIAIQDYGVANGDPQYHHQGTHAMGLVTDEHQCVIGIADCAVMAIGGGSVPPDQQICTHYSMGFCLASGAKAYYDILEMLLALFGFV
jgi:hypothetical protein